MRPSIDRALARKIAYVLLLAILSQVIVLKVLVELIGTADRLSVIRILQHGSNDSARTAAVGITLLALTLIVVAILAVGFFGARMTLQVLKRAVPDHLRIPSSTIILSSFLVGVLFAALNILVLPASPNDPGFAAMTGVVLAFVYVIVTLLLWFAAWRAIRSG